MRSQRTRREFLKDTALAGGGLLLAQEMFAGEAWAQKPQSANERVAFACIGVGGKGDSDTADAARLGDVVAICDVDDNILANSVKKYPNAKPYNDFRKMLNEMGRSIDAVTVSTPDHTHAPAAAMAMQMGKHCFAQKPLTRTLYEARRLGDIARRKKVATQMGNQGTAGSDLRSAAAQIRAGALGNISEVHVWTNRPVWAQGIDRPQPVEVPPTLHWDLWLGPAERRPYGNGYHTFGWRGWWDFGSGALGDMGCHTLNMPFMALDLRNPTSVVAETSGHNKDSFPKWSIVTYEFAPMKGRGPVKLFWYDGGKRPSADLLEGKELPESGSLVIGSKGKMFSGGDYGGGQLLGGATEVKAEYPVSPGHFEEFMRAIHGGEPAMSNFPNYAGPLTETVLLGNLAVWVDGEKIEWDARRLRAKNSREAQQLVRPRYRRGYSL